MSAAPKSVHELVTPSEVRQYAEAIGIMFDGIGRAALDKETRTLLDGARTMFTDFFVPLAVEGAEQRHGK